MVTHRCPSGAIRDHSVDSIRKDTANKTDGKLGNRQTRRGQHFYPAVGVRSQSVLGSIWFSRSPARFDSGYVPKGEPDFGLNLGVM